MNKCKVCGSEMMIDHDEGAEYIHVCMNPKCRNYRQGISQSGEKSEATIQPKGADKSQ